MLQPRKYQHGGRITNISLLLSLLLVNFILGSAEELIQDPDDDRGSSIDDELIRVKRNHGDVTTVLLIDNHEGSFGRSRPSGLLTTTARTFVNDGTTTEFGTQIVGTTLDNGRLYAQLLQTSSRVFYNDKDKQINKQKYDKYYNKYGGQNIDNNINPSFVYDLIKPSEAVVIYPTRSVELLNNITPEKLVQDDKQNELLKSAGELEELLNKETNANVRIFPTKPKDDERELVENLLRAKKLDGFNKRNVDGIKPSKVKSNELPTFTVRHDFAPSGFSVEVEEKKEEKVDKKSRNPKLLFGKTTEKKMDTVTYLGFADFVTTVGNTVIVFMPNTKGENVATTKKEELARPTKKDDIKVASTVKTFLSHTPGMVTKTMPGHNLSMQTSLPTLVADRQTKSFDDSMEYKSSFLAKEQEVFENPTTQFLEPSSEVIEPSETVTYSSISRSSQPTEPLATFATTKTKTFDSKGTKPLGLLKSIGGTKSFNGTTTHFTSLIYGTFVRGTYKQVLQTTSSVFFFPDEQTIEPTAVQSSVEPTEVTTDKDAEDATEVTVNPRQDSENEIERARKVNSETKQQLVEEPDSELITRVIPSNVYKTFTYLTTFFIPADETSTTTSIRSREVISSEVVYITKVVNPNVDELDTSSVQIVPTQVNFIDTTDIDDEFKLPQTRILAPENVVTTTEEVGTTEELTTVTTTTEQPRTEKSTEKLTTTTTTTSTTTTTTTTTEEPKTVATTVEEETTTLAPTTTSEDPQEDEILVGSDEKAVSSIEDDEEEIEVIFKTLYTTYTYLTTYFQESTTSVSSREVVVTNVITSTLDTTDITPSSTTVEPTATVKESEVEIESSKSVVVTDLSSSTTDPGEPVTATPQLPSNELKTHFTTYTYFTTLFEDGSTSVKSRTEVYTNVVTPTSVSVLPSSILANEDLLKSKFEMLLREQQQLTATTESPITTTPEQITVAAEVTTNKPTEQTTESTTESKRRLVIRPTGTAKGRYGTIARKFKRPIKPSVEPSTPTPNDEENSVPLSTPKLEKHDRTVIRKRIRTRSRILPQSTTIDNELGVTTINLEPTNVQDEKVVMETMVTDITSSTSGGRTGNRPVKRIAPPEFIEKSDKIADVLYEDQISSESNTDEIEPSISPTTVLQTSYTTFTYFTTVYKGSSSSDIISRLETITNVVTETVAPDILATHALSLEDATLPITYFTTFTYWTTLYKDGNTVVTSREETISNVVSPVIEPTSTLPIEKTNEIKPTSVIEESVIPTVVESSSPVPNFVPGATPDPVTEPPEPETDAPITTKPIDKVIVKAGIEGDKPEPTTFYTTYTYFTTSYVGDSTVVKSRLETVTNIVNTTISDIDENDLQTGRAVNAAQENQIVPEKTKEPAKPDTLETGLLSTVVSTTVSDGVTTVYSTDIFGTYIDGLYAKILESTTKVLSEDDIKPTPAPAKVEKTGIVSINEGKIVDADGVSTTFFTTKAIGTSIEQLYAQVVESTTSVVVDEDKKSALATLDPDTAKTDVFKTGLVRLIEGSIIVDDTTTFYESRVVGTVIDGRYAQIIESTSSYKIASSIAPTETLGPEVKATGVITASSPTPAIEGSIVDDDSENEDSDDEEDEEEDGDERGKGRVKSRLTFPSRKRTFTPVIRPFASRNRPTFLPKKKTSSPSSAQTITRANFTPTITATPATKSEGILPGSSRNRFGAVRRGSSSSQTTEVKPTSTRKFSGRNRGATATSVPAVTPTAPSLRGRGSSSRVSPTPTLNLSSSRGRGSFRSSSRISSTPVEATIAPRSSPIPGRPRIRPSLSGLPGRGSSTLTSTTSAPPVREEDNDLTTIVTEEPGITANEEPPTTPSTTTTEDPNLARRNSNPLLKFRRPIVPRVTTTTTPKSQSTLAPRRGILNNRNNNRATTTAAPPTTSTTPRSTRTRPASSFANRAQLANRPRPVNNLFPPRGLFKKPQTDEREDGEEGEEEEEEIEEDGDSNVEESAAKEIAAEEPTKPVERDRQGRVLNPVQIKPFSAQRRSRSKRQAVEYGTKGRGTSSYNSRYRRPTSRSYDYYYYDEEVVEAPKPAPQPKPRTSVTRSRQPPASTSPSVQPRIRPTSPSVPTSQRSPFTIREKDTTVNPRTTNFRRSQTTTPRRRTSSYKTTEITPVSRKSTRLRPPQSQLRDDYSRSNQRRGYTSSRRPTTTRGRGRYGEQEDSYVNLPQFDGTITVTHKIPTEATIPFFNGKVTEYRNVITAKPSIEVLGPHQYQTTSTNGGTVIFLNSEITETLPNGLTEVTRFLIKETPTTSVTFTPTTIRGRKTSFSHIVPSTVYEIENVVTTLQPQLSPNAPLANLLLSQLLLGNLNLQQSPNNPLLGLNTMSTSLEPTTEYKTKTTTYVTSVTDQTSTVLPITFRGKEILTTIVDSSVNVITATEYITETIVTTPTVTPNHQINSLLLPALLQAQLLNNQPTTSSSLNLPLDQQIQLLQQQGLKYEEIDPTKLSKDNDIRQDSEEELEEEKEEIKTKKRKKVDPDVVKDTSVITLYVSGRRPGEFSTILSTVVSGEDSSVAVKKRETMLDDIDRLLVEASEVKQFKVLPSKILPVKEEISYIDFIMPGTSEIVIEIPETNRETESLESVLGDVNKYTTKDYEKQKIMLKTTNIINKTKKSQYKKSSVTEQADRASKQ